MKRISMILLVLLLAFSGCSSNPEETDDPSVRPVVEPTVTVTPTPPPEPSPTPTPEPDRHPLNGSPVSEDYEAKRPYAVMINNIVNALPSCGISKADIIYEVLAEGGITRMMAIFSDIHDAGALGSIRSVRPYYLEIARSYDAIVVHAGGSVPESYDKIRADGIDNMDGVHGAYGGMIFYRDANRMYSGYEHSLFTTSELLEEYTEIMELRTAHEAEIDYGLTFSKKAAPDNGESAKSISIKFAGFKTTDFSYNDTDGVYNMTQYGLQYIDGNNQTAIGFSNVMVLFAQTVTLADEYSHLDVSLTGSGDGYLAYGGKIIPIKWYRSADGESFTYKNADGSALEFGIGNTYIGVVPDMDSAGLSFS